MLTKLHKVAVTLGNFFCNLSSNFFAPLQDKLHATWLSVKPLRNAEIFVAVLRGSLRKVEPTSTSRNDCGNKQIVRHVHFRLCYPGQFLLTKLRDNVQKRLPSLTAPSVRNDNFLSHSDFTCFGGGL